MFHQLTTADVDAIKGHIAATGMSKQDLQRQYGLDDSAMGWLTNMGVSFPNRGMGGLAGAGGAPQPHILPPQDVTIQPYTPPAVPPAPAPVGAMPPAPLPFMPPKNVFTNPGGPGLAYAASLGQGGDTTLGHLSAGESVIPREIAAARPDLMAGVDNAIAQAGADPNAYKVGGGAKLNPATGMPQFASDPSIQDWYRNVAGRDAQQGEIDYWNQQAQQLGGQQAFQNFLTGLKANGETLHTTDYGAANMAYQGAQSDSGYSNVDDWARNVFGRAATADEIARFGTATTPEQAQQLYQQFVSAGTAAGGKANAMDLTHASQLPGAAAPAATPAPVPAPAPGTVSGVTGVISPVVGAPAPSYGSGTGLYDSLTVPTANQAELVTLAPAARAAGASVGPAAKGAVSAPVAAGTGLAGSYTATTAPTAAPVAAGTGKAAQATSQGYGATDAQAALRGTNDVAGYGAAQGTAAQWNVNGDQTVQGQLQKITADGSPLMTQAKTDALEAANNKGLANSSMAVEAGQAALYRTALPIAQQDANTFASSGQYNAGNRQQMELANVDAKNTASRFFAQAKNDASGQNAQLQTGVNLSNAGERNKAAEFTASEANRTSQFNAASTNDMIKTNLSNALQAGIVNQDQANRMAALAAQNVNRAAEFNITSADQMKQFNIDEALKAGIINKQQADSMTQFNASQANSMAIAQAQLTQNSAQFNTAQANSMAIAQANLNADISKFNASQSNALLQLGMDGQTKIALGNIEAGYKTLMQANSSAATVYSTAMNDLTSLLTNKDMTPDAKSNAISNLVGTLNGSLNVIGGIANLNLPQLTFGGAAPAPAPAPAPADGGGVIP